MCASSAKQKAHAGPGSRNAQPNRKQTQFQPAAPTGRELRCAPPPPDESASKQSALQDLSLSQRMFPDDHRSNSLLGVGILCELENVDA